MHVNFIADFHSTTCTPHNINIVVQIFAVLNYHKYKKNIFIFFLRWYFSGDKEAISRLAYEFCEDCSKNGIKYVEARYSPHLLSNNEDKPQYAPTRGTLTSREVVETVNQSFKRGCEDFNIRARTILCCMRHRPGICLWLKCCGCVWRSVCCCVNIIVYNDYIS